MFPLLRLPSVAQYEIMKYWDLFQILLLTKVSRRANKLVQTQRIPIELRVAYSKFLKFRKHKSSDDLIGIYITIRPPNRYKNKKTSETWRIGDQVATVDIGQENLWTSWEDAWTGHKSILEFLASNFNIKIASFENDHAGPKENIRVLEHSKSLGLDFGIVYLGLDWKDYEADEAKQIFEVCANAKELTFWPKISQDFCFENFETFTMDKLVLQNAHFVSVNDIIALDKVREITLIKVQFSNLELNQILKMWTSGVVNFKRLFLSVMEDGIESAVVLEGLNAVNQPDESYSVQRSDGANAILRIEKSNVNLVVQNQKTYCFFKTVEFVF